MAKLVITPLQLKPLNEILTEPIKTPGMEELSMVTKYIFRAKIIYDRNFRGFEKAERKGPRGAFKNSGKPIMATDLQDVKKKIREVRTFGVQDRVPTYDDYTYEKVKATTTTPERTFTKDTITILDLDYKDDGVKGYSKITLPFTPRELNYQPTSKFVGIATMGRNNPFYQFTGSEDTLSFEIDWFSNQNDREDVINSCRWLEAMTKSNGYDEMPHRAKLLWGKDNKLFEDDTWIITEAPYILSGFVDSYKEKGSTNIVKVGMLPQQANQTITMKRLTKDNRTTSQIIGNLKHNNYGS